MKIKNIHLFLIVLSLLNSLVLESHAPNAVPALNIGSCQLFPDNNFWNVPIDTLPVHPSSSQWINSIGSNDEFHMDFGSGTWDGGPIGIPYNVLSGNTVNKYDVDFYYPDESDAGPYPISAMPQIEWGGDHHILTVDTDDCTLYEIYDASYENNEWSGGSGAIWDLNSNNLRTDTWTSADAAGLPILPGLARYDEVANGIIEHALRFTVNCTADYYIWPARHQAEHGSCANPVPFGARFRLKASYNISGFSPQAQVLLQAFKTYGIVLADNGSDWYVSGAPSPSWDNDQLHELDVLNGSDFEAVNTSSLMVNYNSGATSITYSISGNAGAPGVTLNYTDGTPKTGTSAWDGSYSIDVSSGWSGTVTPSHSCYTFSPVNRSYSNVTSNHISQNYATTINPACTGIDVTIGNTPKGSYALQSGQSMVQNYNGTNGGPVLVESTDGSNIIASLLQFRRPGTSGEWTDITQTMALTDTQISDAYVFPRYDFSDPKKYNSIQLANFDSVSTTVNVSIGDTLRGSYPLSAGSSQNVTFPGITGGPVVVSSNNGAEIIASLYELKRIGNTGLYTGQTQMMGLPQSQLSNTYIIPRYNYTLQDVIPYVVFANAGTESTQVTVTIGGVLRGTYNLSVGQSTVQNYSGVNGGPVVIQSNNGQNVVASLLQFRRPGTSGEWTGITQTMALTDAQISDAYVFPRYDFSDPKKYNSIQLANFDSISTNIAVTIGGVLRGTYTLAAGSSQNVTFPGITGGPVIVSSNNGAEIIASLYELKRTTDAGLYTGQTQMMGLPQSQLSDTYIIPRYNYTLQDVVPYVIFALP